MPEPSGADRCGQKSCGHRRDQHAGDSHTCCATPWSDWIPQLCGCARFIEPAPSTPTEQEPNIEDSQYSGVEAPVSELQEEERPGLIERLNELMARQNDRFEELHDIALAQLERAEAAEARLEFLQAEHADELEAERRKGTFVADKVQEAGEALGRRLVAAEQQLEALKREQRALLDYAEAAQRAFEWINEEWPAALRELPTRLWVPLREAGQSLSPSPVDAEDTGDQIKKGKNGTNN